MFYYNVGEVSEAGVRRFLRRVGVEHIDNLLKVREADRIGSKVPKAFPYKLRHLLYMIEKVRHDPLHPKMLKIDGTDVMELLKIPPGPKVGAILGILLEDVLTDPTQNTEKYLRGRAEELGALPDKELEKIAARARETKDEFESGIENEMKKKHHVT
jgi:poly(A) polymerase/tRNA nucleotidyltransferase (CCA-adding enzyme)